VGVLLPVGVHGACGPQRRRPAGRARPDTRALAGRCSLSAWPGGRRRSRRSLPDPRGVWVGQPWLRRGRLLTVDSMAGGKVIHQLGRSVETGTLPALVNNFGRRIRVRVRIRRNDVSRFEPLNRRGGHPACRRGCASGHPGNREARFRTLGRAITDPPGWKPRLYGRQDARRYTEVHGEGERKNNQLCSRSWTAAGSEAPRRFWKLPEGEKRCRRSALPPHSRRWRDSSGSSHCAKRLECGAFTAALPPDYLP